MARDKNKGIKLWFDKHWNGRSLDVLQAFTQKYILKKSFNQCIQNIDNKIN